MTIENEFDGVFKFTNKSDEDFTALWNNKEYIFPAMTTCPMIIANETLENIQNIRKMFAKKLAKREFHKTKEFKKMEGMGKGLPPLYDEKVLEAYIQSCLVPLPIGKVKTKELPKDSERNYKASKAISEKDNPNFVFKDEQATELGEQSANFAI